MPSGRADSREAHAVARQQQGPLTVVPGPRRPLLRHPPAPSVRRAWSNELRSVAPIPVMRSGDARLIRLARERARSTEHRTLEPSDSRLPSIHSGLVRASGHSGQGARSWSIRCRDHVLRTSCIAREHLPALSLTGLVPGFAFRTAASVSGMVGSKNAIFGKYPQSIAPIPPMGIGLQ